MALDRYTLKLRQAMPLKDKIRFTENRIYEWVNRVGVNGTYISFSGGKDSTVLLDLVRNLYPKIEALFVDTGLEYPEIKKFVKTKENVTILRPKMMFNQVIEKYGYPIISKSVSDTVELAKKNIIEGKETLRVMKLKGELMKNDGTPSFFNCSKWAFLLDAPFKISNKCCNVMKKTPAREFNKLTGKLPIIGTMAEESLLRTKDYLKHGCNSFNGKKPHSTPIAFWTEQDILEYIVTKNLDYASVYGEIKQDQNGKYYTTGCNRTGCMFCGFGCHLEKEPNRFQMMKKTHPTQWDYCINKLGLREVLDYIGVKYE